MPTVVTSFVTITCDGRDCSKTATFPQSEQGEAQAMIDNVWMQSLRFVQTPDNRKFTYCSDECEAIATGLGIHNKAVIVPATQPNSIGLAAQAAARAAEATKALKAGGAKIELT